MFQISSFLPTGQAGKFQNKGFTLLEVVIAVFFVTVSMGGVFTVIQKSFDIISISGSRLVAANLAQEGIEVVRNIRDTNWLEGENWDKGLDAGEWEVQYDDGDGDLTAWADLYLHIDNGFYKYLDPAEPDKQTRFKRKVIISDELDGSKKIIVEVMWKERGGKEYTYTAQGLLYDWK